jgi:hypothetical protein
LEAQEKFSAAVIDVVDNRSSRRVPSGYPPKLIAHLTRESSDAYRDPSVCLPASLGPGSVLSIPR